MMNQPDNIEQRSSVVQVLQERRRQMAIGHTDAHDDQEPSFGLLEKARDSLIIAIENARGVTPDADLKRAWKRATVAAALILAGLDRIERSRPALAEPETGDLFSTSQV